MSTLAVILVVVSALSTGTAVGVGAVMAYSRQRQAILRDVEFITAMSHYPTLEQVRTATVREIVGWIRFLPSPTDEQRPVMEAILERHQQFSHVERVAASKAVGW